MNLCKRIVWGAMALTVVPAIACFAGSDGDMQYWNTESMSVKVNKNFRIEAEEEFRFADDMSDFVYTHTDAGIVYSGLADYLDVGINYRLIFEEKGGGDWQYTNTPHINATLKYTLGDIKLSNRGRLEYNDKEKGDDGFRYRNKFTVKYPMEIARFQFSPYVSDEIFVDFVSEEFSRNRLYSGISAKIVKNVSLNLFYLWQYDKRSNHWESKNVFGSKIKVSF